MHKVSLAVYKNDLPRVIDALQSFGAFEAVSPNEEKIKNTIFAPATKKETATDLRLAELDFAIRLLAPYDTAKKNFRQKVLGASVEATEEDARTAAKNFDFQKVIARCADIEEALNTENAELLRIAEAEHTLSAWKNLNFALRFSRASLHAEMRIGYIHTKDFADFAVQIGRLPLADLSVVHETLAHTYFFTVFHRTAKRDAETLLETFRFTEMDFSQFERTPREELAHCHEAKKSAEAKIVRLKEELTVLAVNLPQLKLAHDYYLWEKEKEAAETKSFASERVVILEGWVPVERHDELAQALTAVSSHIHFVKIAPEAEESAPVEIKNNAFFAPYESVTRIFGLPLAHEIDPTPYLAPFFAIFFGFCLTDAGYGILLIISTLLALKFLPLDRTMRGMMQLLFMTGITTVFMGVLFGGWFGMTIDQAPGFLISKTNPKMFIGQIFDPINDLTGKIMPLAYALGVIHLWFGVILSGVVKLKNSQKADAWTTSFPLALVIVLAVVMGLSSLIGLSAAVFAAVKYSFFVLLALIVWGMGAGTKNPISRILIGILGLANEAMGWLSNVLSYSRLFALGLATGIIAAVFNSVALTIGGMLPAGISIIVVVFVILFGHVLNIALNLLGAYIHSGRLQFVEFFGKFLESGGRAFVPLARRSRYLFTEKI